MKKILCLVDFANVANSAAEYAAHLAQQSVAELVLMHVLPFPTLQEAASVGYGLDVSSADLEKELYEKLETYRHAIKDQFDIKCNVFVQRNTSSLTEAVKEQIEDEKYDLIVMGTNGAEDLRQFFFGTHSHKLIKNVTAPLLIISEGYKFKKPKHIVYATDYEEEDAIVLKKVFHLTTEFEPEITVLHVSNKPTNVSQIVYCSIKNILEDELDNPNINCERIFEKDAATGINNYMKKGDKDLLVLLSKDYLLAEKLFHKSVIDNINKIATYPLLIIHSTIPREHVRIISPDIVFLF